MRESVNNKDEKNEIIQKVELSFFKRFKNSFFLYLFNLKDNFLFSRTLTLLNFIIEKNRAITGAHSIEIKEYLFTNYDRILKMLDFFEKVNFEIMKIVRNKILNQEINFRNFDHEVSNIFYSFQKKIKDDILFFDFNSKEIISKESKESEIRLKESKNLGNYERVNLKIDSNTLLYNIREEKDNSEEKIKNFVFKDAINLLIQVLISNWEIFCYFLIIFYFFYNNGLSYIPLFIYLFAYLILEEKKAKMFAWKICFIYFAIISCLKFFLYLPIVTPFKETQSLDEYTSLSSYLPLIQVWFNIKYFKIFKAIFGKSIFNYV